MEMVVQAKREKLLNVVFSEKLIILTTIFLISLCAAANPWFGIVVAYALGLWLLIKSNYKFLIYFICFIFIQNITLMVLAEKFTTTTHSVFSLGKEIMIYLFFLKSLFFGKKKLRLNFTVLVAIAFTLLLGLSFIRSDAEFFAKAISIRQLFLPFVCFFFGYFLIIDEKQKRRIFDLIVVLGIITTIVGFIDYFIVKDSFWLGLPIEKFEENKGTVFELYKGVPLNFYTWDVYNFTGLVLRRLVSHFTDPLTTAHFLFLAFIVASFSNAKHKRLIQALFLFASFLTFSKGIYVCYLVFFVIQLFRNISYKAFKWIAFVAILLMVVVFPIGLTIVNKLMPTSSIVIHINGFLKGITGSSLFGEGIGKAGVVLSKKTATESLTGESYIGVISSQLGILGMITYILFNISLFFVLFYLFKIKKHKFALSVLCIVAGILLECFFSESSVGIVATGLYFIFAGMEFSKTRLTETKVIQVVEEKEEEKAKSVA